jgi:hypothetical protein
MRNSASSISCSCRVSSVPMAREVSARSAKPDVFRGFLRIEQSLRLRFFREDALIQHLALLQELLPK